MRIRNILLIFSFGCLFFSCNNKKDQPKPELVTPIISNFSLPKKHLNDPDFKIIPPTSNSSGKFTYTSDNPSVAIVAGDIISIKGIGNTEITVTQQESGNYSSTQYTVNFTVLGIIPTIGTFPNPKMISPSQYLFIPPTSNNTEKFTFTTSDPKVAVINKDTLTIVGKGTALIVGAQIAGGNFASSSDTITMTSAFAPVNGAITDIDNITYTSVSIGNQIWLLQNLKTSRYNNGDVIPYGGVNNEWASLTTGACIIYNGDKDIFSHTGYLYNKFAITDKRGITPSGWHIPSVAEWNNLTNFEGGSTTAGAALKQEGFAQWTIGTGSVDGNNKSGFTALPGGFYIPNQYGDFELFSQGAAANFWTVDVMGTTKSYFFSVLTTNEIKIAAIEDQCGFSIRCLQDYIVTFK